MLDDKSDPASGKEPAFQGEENTGELIDALDHYRKEWDDKLGTWKDHPLHDWSSHGSKAFECFARGYSGTSTDTKKRRRPRTNRYMAM